MYLLAVDEQALVDACRRARVKPEEAAEIVQAVGEVKYGTVEVGIQDSRVVSLRTTKTKHLRK